MSVEGDSPDKSSNHIPTAIQGTIPAVGTKEITSLPPGKQSVPNTPNVIESAMSRAEAAHTHVNAYKYS